MSSVLSAHGVGVRLGGRGLLDSVDAAQFYKPMVGNTFNGEGLEVGIANVVRQEAAALGKPSSVADDFISRMNWRYKKGGYWINCGTPGTTCTTGQIADVTETGHLVLPVKTIPTDYSSLSYVFGRFIDEVNISCPGCPSGATVNNIANNVDKEMFREIIRSALTTF